MIEQGVRVGGGEALVQQMKAGVGVLFAQSLRERLRLDGLGAHVAGGMEGKADHNVGDSVLTHDACQGLEVCAELGAMQGKERLRGVAEGIRDGESNAAVTNVEGEDAALRLRDSRSFRRLERLGGRVIARSCGFGWVGHPASLMAESFPFGLVQHSGFNT